MLLLTSINDRLQIVTNQATVIHVHASWVDTSTGTITPGRTNTVIAAAATTSIAGAPAASTQRNIKTLHIRNTDPTFACDITVQHTDGTTVSQLYKITLGPSEQLEYTDQGGFGAIRAAGAPLPAIPLVAVISTTGVFTPAAGMVYCVLDCIGGGGGGGGATGGGYGYYIGGGGGGSGGFSRKTVSAATFGASQMITIGAGGAGGTFSTTTPGASGGSTSVGGLCSANGGTGGFPGGTGLGLGQSGLGGAPGTGDIVAGGAPGGAGEYRTGPVSEIGYSGQGGSSHYGGGGRQGVSTSNAAHGFPATGYGSGGSGATVSNDGNGGNGGNGMAGIAIIVQYFR